MLRVVAVHTVGIVHVVPVVVSVVCTVSPPSPATAHQRAQGARVIFCAGSGIIQPRKPSRQRACGVGGVANIALKPATALRHAIDDTPQSSALDGGPLRWDDTGSVGTASNGFGRRRRTATSPCWVPSVASNLSADPLTLFQRSSRM